MNSRLRFGLQAPSTRTAGIVTASLAWGVAVAIGYAQTREGGCCPQSRDGWVLFEDSNPRVPDFWRRDSVVVDVIDVCRHGINIYFLSEEDGQPRYVALIVVKPSRELYETRVVSRIGGLPIETRVELAERKYADLLSALDRLFDVSCSPGGRLDFTTSSLGDRPVIFPCRGLTLRWQGSAVALRGYLDVYMTMFS